VMTLRFLLMTSLTGFLTQCVQCLLVSLVSLFFNFCSWLFFFSIDVTFNQFEGKVFFLSFKASRRSGTFGLITIGFLRFPVGPFFPPVWFVAFYFGVLYLPIPLESCFSLSGEFLPRFLVA